jgi:hypothetical protein
MKIERRANNQLLPAHKRVTVAGSHFAPYKIRFHLVASSNLNLSGSPAAPT